MRIFVVAVAAVVLAVVMFLAIASVGRLALSAPEALLLIGVLAVGLYVALARLTRRGRRAPDR